MLFGQIECNWMDGDLWSLTLEKGYLHDLRRTSAIERSFLHDVEERNQHYDRAKDTSQQTHADQD